MVQVLLTGFGAYHATSENPSSVISSKLNGEILSSPPNSMPGAMTHRRNDTEISAQQALRALKPVTARVHVDFVAVRVNYEIIQRRVEAWHTSDKWDAIVHVGYAPAFKGVGVETWARRVGYSSTVTDMAGHIPPVVTGGIGIEGDIDRYETNVDCEGLVAALKTAGYEHTFVGKDPGDFNCAFTYALSLKFSQAVAKESRRRAIPVVLILIPPSTEDKDQPGTYTSQELADYLRGVCWFVGQQAARDKGDDAASSDQ